MLISETHLTKKYNFNIAGFVFHKTNHPDGKAHGVTGILVRNRLRHFALNEYSNTSVYCPPRFIITKDKFEEFFSSLGNRFLACGDNAKHTFWGCRLQNPNGNQLYKVLMDNNNGFDFCPSTTY